jgi:hypothetical protein
VPVAGEAELGAEQPDLPAFPDRLSPTMFMR